jgi:CRISPR-associated endonuclease/helicase Cas3
VLLETSQAPLWAKTKKRAEGVTVHPLICHLIDVAAMAEALWDGVFTDAQRRFIARGLGLSPGAARAWVTFLAGLHDLGKACPAFQLMTGGPERLQRAIAELTGPLPIGFDRRSTPHGSVSAKTLPALLQDSGVSSSVATELAKAVGGHHGTFDRIRTLETLPLSGVGKHRWLEWRRDLFSQLAEVLALADVQPPPQAERAAVIALAGLVSVADWLASDETRFPYLWDGSGSELSVDDAYFALARSRTTAALAAFGWLHWPASWPTRTFVESFPWLGSVRPLQSAVASLADEHCRQAPGLVIIEAPMGEGKTEAALFLASRWTAELGSRGFYVALPTQATSNQMYSRVRRFLESQGQASLELQLLHGHAELNAEFEVERRDLGSLPSPSSVDLGGEGGEGNVRASAWFRHKKRGLLAPFGVGTIDQLLQAGLQTGHVFVRLFGLCQRVIVIDEVHAYDTYMSTLLERVVEWLAALGSPVVLLSATLPSARRAALIASYVKGCGHELPAVSSVPYPRVTFALPGSGVLRGVPVAAAMPAKRLLLRWQECSSDSLPQFTSDLLKRLDDGGCAAVVCNTVTRAQDVYLAFKQALASSRVDCELRLLHARFPYGDRLERELACLRKFGPPSRDRVRPHRAVLVATQLIEQSLDLDFDVLVSDFAPVDLLLQRAGRLHRHARARPVTRPEFWILTPRQTDSREPQFDSGTQAVYDEYVLLRTWMVLRARTAIDLPHDIEPLVEAVYLEHGDEGPVELRARLASARQASTAASALERDEAQIRWLKPPNSGCDLADLTGADLQDDEDPALHQSFQAMTRLTGTSVQVVCLHRHGHRICLDPTGQIAIDPDGLPNSETTRRLMERSMPLSTSRDRETGRRNWGLASVIIRDITPWSAWQRSALLRYVRPLVFDADALEVTGWQLRLDNELGLVSRRLRARLGTP